jgi:hypothetical protein
MKLAEDDRIEVASPLCFTSQVKSSTHPGQLKAFSGAANLKFVTATATLSGATVQLNASLSSTPIPPLKKLKSYSSMFVSGKKPNMPEMVSTAFSLFASELLKR